MHFSRIARPAHEIAFHTWRSVTARVPGRRIQAFGHGAGLISAITVINLDRQPERWRGVARELGRFRTSEGRPLTEITRRLAAVDARDGRSAAATADVDSMYRVGDQLYVQPDARLAACFAVDEPVRMTQQEVAVARSHVEAWKAIAGGSEEHVLVLEDDIWFTPGARRAIERGWRAARIRCRNESGPALLYLSYSDADGTRVREDECSALFRPSRGLWFLSGYVLSREAAAMLLRAMPVVGPVDLWMNFRFAELGALALRSPAIAQRIDVRSDNSYSMLPYLARAGVIDARQAPGPPPQSGGLRVMAWTNRREREGLAMALSMLGMRVRAFDGDEHALDLPRLYDVMTSFDALVDAPLQPSVLAAVAADEQIVVIMEAGARAPLGVELLEAIGSKRAVVVGSGDLEPLSWAVLCDSLGLIPPVDPVPVGPLRSLRLFRDYRQRTGQRPDETSARLAPPMDESPWVLPHRARWEPVATSVPPAPATGPLVALARMDEPSEDFPHLVETFPGNLAWFAPEGVVHGEDGARLRIERVDRSPRPYRSGAFGSARSYGHGLFEAEVQAARGPGLVTGFFLHREGPRQEIDIEFPGSHPDRMLVNVYFNPGDDGAAMNFGYRGSPSWVDLGFDASAGLHRYAIDWRPDRIAWLVDGQIVYERVGWDPTPIPHLEMRLHGNVWAPRSGELAGRVDDRRLPAAAIFRNVLVRSQLPHHISEGSQCQCGEAPA